MITNSVFIIPKPTPLSRKMKAVVFMEISGKNTAGI
jgi:hypothetical protein